ncbi:MAG TPA: DUF1343 domain-containing protein [Longimicrobiales bacterium]|nr:DUF1343 domain-containing protein [Longimicrobiales bacterium]
MRRLLPWVLALGACARAGEADGGAAASTGPQEVRPGLEVLLTDSLHLVAGRRAGLITNHTGIDREGRSAIDVLHEHPEVDLVAIYAPEHGIRGDLQAGIEVAEDVDPRTGLPVYSLYGDTRAPTPEMLAGVDVLLFDMQDVGARYYTYVSTMALAMEAAGEQGIPFVVLDRPNPIRGDVVQGNVLDPDFATFVGMFPVPMRHGMTPGELARLYVGEFGVEVELSVVPVEGWRRSMSFDQTGLPWVPPSPNMPALESALAYPGTCLFEGTPLSVGRGTARAFQWVGAPWLDGEALAEALSAYAIEGVRFEPATFTPVDPGDGKFPGQEVHGVRLIAESPTYDAPRAAVAMLVEARRLAGERWSWQSAHFDRLAGADALRLGLERGLGVQELTAAWAAEAEAFERLREPYLLYR